MAKKTQKRRRRRQTERRARVAAPRAAKPAPPVFVLPALPAPLPISAPAPRFIPALPRPQFAALPWRTLGAIVTFCVIITAPRFIPQLHNWHIYEWETAQGILDFHDRTPTPTPLEDQRIALRPAITPRMPQPSALVDPNGHLGSFYDALFRAERRDPGARVRILHYGDSPTTADLITSDTRALLQEKFGDAGHGTYLIAKPWAWYAHAGLDTRSGGWTIDPATLTNLKDGLYGLGGVSFRGSAGAVSTVLFAKSGHSRASVSYLSQPGGGAVQVESEGHILGEIDTDAPQVLAGAQEFPLAAGSRSLTLRVTRGQVRLFGYAFYKDSPGVLYDSIGLNGAYARVLARFFNFEHWSEQLRQARPDLVIVNYGTNESVYAPYVDTQYENELTEVIQRLKTASPQSAIMVMSPMDRGERQAGGVIGTVPVMNRLVALQERIAHASGVAFFNTFQAMGGAGTMGRWYNAEPRLVSADFIHPMPSGARIVGTLFYKALLEGYYRHKLKKLNQQLNHTGTAAAGEAR
jgi:lysophospholipase L1-like esterase